MITLFCLNFKIDYDARDKINHRDTEAQRRTKNKNRIGKIAFGGRIGIYFFILPPKAILPILFFCFYFSCVFSEPLCLCGKYFRLLSECDARWNGTTF
jgi:hypothetical protein